MIGALILAMAQTGQPLAMPEDSRGRWLCKLVARPHLMPRMEASTVDLWLYDGKASVTGYEAGRLPAVRDAAISTELTSSGEGFRTFTHEFRSGSTTVRVTAYEQARAIPWAHLAVMHDADDARPDAYPTASGFCAPMVLSVVPKDKTQ